MPDSALNLALTGPLADDLRAAADACDLPVEDYLRAVLQREAANAAEALGWHESIDEDLEAAKDFEDTGEGVPWEEVKPWLQSLTTDDPLPRPKPRKLK